MLKADILPQLGGLNLKGITREKVKGLALAGLAKGQASKDGAECYPMPQFASESCLRGWTSYGEHRTESRKTAPQNQ